MLWLLLFSLTSLTGCSDQGFQNQKTETLITTPSDCGDGEHNSYEECDDGNNLSGDGCSEACFLEYCGDGVHQPTLNEDCDDGNSIVGDGCGHCAVEECGDGTVHPKLGEECDDGNETVEDGCHNCVEEYCGDGILQKGLGEECDDNNDLTEDGCDSCLEEYCGDGIVQAGLGEECDDANKEDEDGCNTCIKEYCGDGILQQGLGETCDDGNKVDDDECNNTCTVYDDFCPDGGTSVLVNPGFEDGTSTGWTSSGTLTMTSDAHDGTTAASTVGNYYLRQDLTKAVSVAALNKATFWTWHEADDSPLQSIEWGYSDGSIDSGLLYAADLAYWVQADLLAQMDVTKDLSYIKVWGYSGGGKYVDLTLYDTFEFCED